MPGTKNIVAAGGWLLCIILGQAVLAQEEEDLEMEIFFAPAETVTSAVRHDQPIEQSPAAITVLTREDIRASGARTLPEVLRLVPNMDVAMIKPNWYLMGIRGMSAGAADSLLLLVDGRDSTLEFFGWPAWTMQPYSLDDVERIEVIRGPGSALYGANSYSGVVHVITRRPGEGPLGSFNIRGGEKGTTDLHMRGSRSFGPVGVALEAGWVCEGLWTSREGTGKDQLRGRLMTRIDLGDSSNLDVEIGALQTSGTSYSIVGDVDLDSVRNLYATARYQYEDLTVQAVFDQYDFDALLDMKLYYQELDVLLARLPPIVGAQNKVSVQAQHGTTLFHNRLTYGAEYVVNLFHADTLDPADHDEHRAGIYLQDEFDLSGLIDELGNVRIPPLVITAGLRFDYNSITDHELSPRASLVFSPSPNHGIRLGYAHAFLKPTFFQSSVHLELEDASNLGFTRLNMANPDLKNQTIDSLELGYQTSLLDGLLQISLDLSMNWYRNTIVFELDPEKIPYTLIGGLRVPDLGSASFGSENHPDGYDGHTIEFKMVVRPSEKTRLFAQAGYRQIFNNRTGAFDRAAPVLRAAAGFDANLFQQWSLAIRAYYASPYTYFVARPESVILPKLEMRTGHNWLLNARLAINLVEGPFSLSAGVEGFNLLNQRFREYPGTTRPNQPDYVTERLGRRVLFFLSGEI